MIPSNFNKLGVRVSYELIGIQSINGAYIDLGFTPEDDSNISFSAQAPYSAGGVCSAYGSGEYATVYYFNGKGTTGIIRSRSTYSTQATAAYTAGANIIITNFNAQNITINGKLHSFDASVTPMTGSDTLKLFTYSVGTLKTPIYYFNYQSSTKDYQYIPKIQPDNSVKLVDKLTGSIPTHVGEFEPVFDKKSGDGDCLINGQFSKVAPNGIVTGGSCLINGDSYFRDRKDVARIEGSFANLTQANHMFYGTNVTSVPEDAFPRVKSLISSFFNTPLTEFKCEVPDLLTVTYCFYLCKFTTFESDFSKVDNLSFTFYRCSNLVNVKFINGLPKLSKASPNAFSDCTKLSSESIDNIVNALPVITTALEIGFSNVPMTQAQYDTFIAKGWTPTGAIIS